MKRGISRNRAKYARGERERERKSPALGISIFLLLSRPPFRCCFFRRYSLIAFPRVCPFLVTFLKLITSAPSASFVSFPPRWSVRVPTLPLHLFPAVAAFLLLISANGFALTASSLPFSLCSLPFAYILFFLIPQDLASSSKTFFPVLAAASTLFSLHVTAKRLCSSHRWM